MSEILVPTLCVGTPPRTLRVQASQESANPCTLSWLPQAAIVILVPTLCRPAARVPRTAPRTLRVQASQESANPCTLSWLPISAIVCVAFCAFLLLFPSPLAAQRFASAPYGTPAGSSPTADMLREVGIEQRLDGRLPLDALFRDEAGREVALGEFFGDQPVVLALAYYRCPMLCTQVLNGLLKSSQAVPLEIGRDYQVVTVSFDPSETPELAAEKRDRYVRAYRRAGAADGWHFLTGERQAIDRLTRAVGFRYRYDPSSGQFAHASGIMLATPDGRLARYFYGIEFSPRDLRLGLIESSSGRVGSPVDQVLLLCYHYDPLTGKYGLAISAALRVGGSLTVLVLAGFLVAMFRRERRTTKRVRGGSPAAAPDGVGVSRVGVQGSESGGRRSESGAQGER